jgi:hypothetical protein
MIQDKTIVFSGLGITSGFDKVTQAGFSFVDVASNHDNA